MSKSHTANTPHKAMLALIIPGYNEAVVIRNTIQSAIDAGLPIDHIYMVDDGSNDGTADLAREFLPVSHVLSIPNGGKARAILAGLTQWKIADHYDWVHIADADSHFESNYFEEFIGHLDPNCVAATGYVKSMKTNWISKYRAYEYSFGQEISRRLQHMLGVIPVIPGPTSCFRTDILDQLDFTTPNITEDFDITLQIHRKKLGKIAFIPSARTLTQDPKDYKDYVKQVTRWYRGFWQGVSQRKIGLGFQRIDGYLGYQMLEMFAYYFNVLILLPFFLITGHGAYGVALAFLVDTTIFFFTTLFAAVAHNRPDIISAFPLFYVLRITNMALYLREFVNVMLLRRYRVHSGGWSTEGRRFEVTDGATS